MLKYGINKKKKKIFLLMHSFNNVEQTKGNVDETNEKKRKGTSLVSSCLKAIIDTFFNMF